MSHDDCDSQNVRRRSLLRSLAGVGALATAGPAAAGAGWGDSRDADRDDDREHDRRHDRKHGREPGRDPGPKESERLVGCAADADHRTVVDRVDEETPSSVTVAHENEALGYAAIECPSERMATQFAPRIRQLDGVEYVEENATVEAFLEPDDPLFPQQYAPQQVDADEAWDRTLGSTDVTVAVVDSGVASDHPDLAPLFGSDPGRDFVDDDGDPAPETADEQHGTLVAGAAAAKTNNATGIAGVSDPRILAARALDGSGGGAVSDVADAVQWSADAGADVINLSLGGSGDSRTMRRAVRYAYRDRDALVVAAAGNEGQRGISYPARYEDAVAVTAVDSQENAASFSNYGPTTEVTAPGVNVATTAPPSTYARVSGTSFAAPVVSGVAALGLAVAPDLSAEELRAALRETATDLGISSERQGAGQVDADALLEAVAASAPAEPPTAAVTASDAEIAAGEPVTFDGSQSSDPDGEIVSYEWTFGDGETATGPVVEHTYEAAGEYTATLTVTDDDGATDTATVTVTVTPPAQTCSDSVSGRVSSALYGGWDSDRWRWASRLSETCEVTVSLDGPSGANFDLYATGDGRRPTTDDADASSTAAGSDESVTLTEVGDAVGILVDGVRGGGSYQLTVEETGTDDATATAQASGTTTADGGEANAADGARAAGADGDGPNGTVSEIQPDGEAESPPGDRSGAPSGDRSEAPSGDRSGAPSSDRSEAPSGDRSEARTPAAHFGGGSPRRLDRPGRSNGAAGEADQSDAAGQ